MLRIGVVGAGRIGRLHAENICASGQASLEAVFDADAQVSATTGNRLGVRIAESTDALIDDANIDAVFICSPTDTHVDLVKRAAKAGKAVFCEKPIDLEIERVKDCLNTLEQYPVPFTVGFHRRFDPHHQALRRAISDGELGEVEQIRIVSRDPVPPPGTYIERSGGIFRDMMIHDLDQCRFLLGQPVVKVFAQGSALFDSDIRDAGDFDTATAVLSTANGATVAIQNSRHSATGFDQRIEIFGSKGSMAMENVPLTHTVRSGRDGVLSDRFHAHFPERYAEAYRAELSSFLTAVETGTQPATSAYDGYASLMLADAADRSAQTGTSVPVDLER